MNPVTQSLPAAPANAGRNAAANDGGKGANFASLISSLSTANAQPAAAQAPQPQNKPAQANGKPNPNQGEQALPDAAPNSNAAQPQAAGHAPTPTQAREESKDEDQDETQAAAHKAGIIDPAAQLLALTQEAQSLAQGRQTAAAEVRDGASDPAGAARAHAARAGQKAELLAAAGREEVLDAGAPRDTADTGFADRIAGALTLHADKSAHGEEAQTLLQSRPDTPAPQAAAQALAGAQLRQAQSLSAGRAPGEQLAPRVGAAGWDRALGQKVVWMVGQGEQSASLSLNPPELGPLQVVLTVSHTHASADFSAAQPEVRQALQDALPRLREMLADAGIALGQANVHAGTGGDAQQAGQGSGARGGNGGGAQESGQGSAAAIETRVSAPQRQGLGLVNTFA